MPRACVGRSGQATNPPPHQQLGVSVSAVNFIITFEWEESMQATVTGEYFPEKGLTTVPGCNTKDELRDAS